MMLTILSVLLAVFGSFAGPLNVVVRRDCMAQHPRSGLSPRYYEHMAHAAHSLTVQGLQIFNPRATENNRVPTVNMNMTAPVRVIHKAPSVPLDSYFTTSAMRAVDTIMNNIGKENDGLGPAWSPVERLAHYFHMNDLWETIKLTYDDTVRWNRPSDELCACVSETDANGVTAAVQWVADHYKSGTPISLLNRPIPKLTDAVTWSVWRDRLHHYYTKEALKDAAIYMYCTTKDF